MERSNLRTAILDALHKLRPPRTELQKAIDEWNLRVDHEKSVKRAEKLARKIKARGLR